MTSKTGYSKKHAAKIQYSNLPSIICPKPYDIGEEPPTPFGESLMIPYFDELSHTDYSNDNASILDSSGDEYPAATKSISQQQLDLFIRKSGLSKTDAMLAGSMLHDFGILDTIIKMSVYKTCDKEFMKFKQDVTHDFIYCRDIPGER